MSATADYLEFAPPRPPGRTPAMVMALIAHLLLLGALAWGVNWKHKSQELAAEAELWASVPVQAAPKAVEAPPPPPPVPEVVKPPPPAPVVKETDIALEREKKKQAEDKKRDQDLERQKLVDQKKQDALKKKQDELKKKQDELKAAELQKKQEEEDAKQAEVQRQENLKRIAGMAGATGAANATGAAQRAAGPSNSYQGRVIARVKPNIVFSDDVPGNPVAEVEVRAAPDGTIVGRKIVKSSGIKSWDDAVIKALDKTEVLPRDVDGSVPPSFIIAFRPKG